MRNFLEPWVLLRLVAGLVACLLFARGAMTAQKVLRRFDVSRATEGQLALERQIELASTFVRVGAVFQALTLLLTVLTADHLSHGVRGAMCAYGVFSSNTWGFRSLAITVGVAVLAGTVAQCFAFDARVRNLELARAVSILTLAMFPLSVLDLAAAEEFLGALDLTVVASCCSVQLDSVAATGEGFAAGPRVLATIFALLGIGASIVMALFAARSPTRGRVVAAGIMSLIALPVAIAASVLEVAPHAFETPHHVCPFCLFRADAFGMGYPLYGALFLATVWGAGAFVSALLARRPDAADALRSFARTRLLRGAVAWGLVVALGVLPVLRYFIVSGGATLFP